MSRNPILMRYSARITLYDENGNVRRRDEKLFRLRRLAKEYADNLKREHNRQEISSFIEIVKLSENQVVETVKSKRLRKNQK